MIAFSKTYSKGKLWLSLVLCLWTFHITFLIVQFSSVQLLTHVRLFVTPWTATHQASLSITNSRSLLKLVSIESVIQLSVTFCFPWSLRLSCLAEAGLRACWRPPPLVLFLQRPQPTA